MGAAGGGRDGLEDGVAVWVVVEVGLVDSHLHASVPVDVHDGADGSVDRELKGNQPRNLADRSERNVPAPS